MPIAFAAPGLLRNALSGSGRLNAMEAAGPGSGIPDPSMTYFDLHEMGEMGEAELKESGDVDAQELKDINKDIGVEAQKIKDIKENTISHALTPAPKSIEFTEPEARTRFHTISQSPRRQLLSYVAHIGGGGGSGAEVFARKFSRSNAAGGDDGESWCSVGRIAAAVAESKANFAAAANNNDDDGGIVEALTVSTQLQRRLIEDHACRVNQDLRCAKEVPGIELAFRTSDDGTRIVVPRAEPSTTAPSISERQMFQVGFLGTVTGRGIYQTFEEDGGAMAYDRNAIRNDIESMISSSEIVVLAWPQCGFANKARRLLADSGYGEEQQHYADLVIDKFGPLHAELALTTGRLSVPYIFVDGVLVGGCDEDRHHPGLSKALEVRKRSQA